MRMSVCLSVYPRTYLWNHRTNLQVIILCVLSEAVARSSFGGVAICYVLSGSFGFVDNVRFSHITLYGGMYTLPLKRRRCSAVNELTPLLRDNWLHTVLHHGQRKDRTSLP